MLYARSPAVGHAKDGSTQSDRAGCPWPETIGPDEPPETPLVVVLWINRGYVEAAAGVELLDELLLDDSVEDVDAGFSDEPDFSALADFSDPDDFSLDPLVDLPDSRLSVR